MADNTKRQGVPATVFCLKKRKNTSRGASVRRLRRRHLECSVLRYQERAHACGVGAAVPGVIAGGVTADRQRITQQEFVLRACKQTKKRLLTPCTTVWSKYKGTFPFT